MAQSLQHVFINSIDFRLDAIEVVHCNVLQVNDALHKNGIRQIVQNFIDLTVPT